MSKYRFPNLLLIGAQKCGTTHIHQVLSSSLEVTASKSKELNFFNRREHTLSDQIENYQNHFPIGPQRYYIESTPHYFRLPISSEDYDGPVTRDVAKAIAAMIPGELQLLAILRNPVERAISASIHHMAQGRIPYQTMLDEIHYGFGIVARGYFFQILEHWRSYFAKQLHVLYYDDLERDPAAFYRNLADHLKLDASFLNEQELTQRSNSADKLVESAKLRKKPTVSPELVRNLLALYRSDIENLFASEEVHYPVWLDEVALIEKLCGGE